MRNGPLYGSKQKAPMYLSKHAFDPHYSVIEKERRYNGIDVSLKNSDRYVFAGELLKIDEELTLFSGVKGRKCYSHANDSLYSEKGGVLVQDDFSHEQSMLVEEDGKSLLLGGCAHTGIVNIIEKCIAVTGKTPSCVISGFHLYNPSLKKSEPKKWLRNLPMHC
jgi:7,8-dihydropterin-6-yl-methyl-4-(beta-D-ribofuranosyl)aminobenzene 5'-phosphate synthase